MRHCQSVYAVSSHNWFIGHTSRITNSSSFQQPESFGLRDKLWVTVDKVVLVYLLKFENWFEVKLFVYVISFSTRPRVISQVCASITSLFWYRIVLFNMFINCLIFGTSSRHFKLCSRAKSTTVVVLVDAKRLRATAPDRKIPFRNKFWSGGCLPLWDFRISLRRVWRWLSCGMLRCVVITKMMEAVSISGTTVCFYRITWRNILDVSHLNAYLSSDASVFVLTPEWVLSSHVTCICAYYPPVQIAGWAETSRGRTPTFI
jgi:hypothetical protein